MIMETEHCSSKNKESLMRSKGAFMCGNNVGLGNRISLTREIKMLTQELIFAHALNKSAQAGIEREGVV